MSKENIAFCRALYKTARLQTGCPPCIAWQPKPIHFGWYVEVKDGSFSLEQIQADNSWDAKWQCVMGWQAQRKRDEECVKTR